jgi:hypothetical protein
MEIFAGIATHPTFGSIMRRSPSKEKLRAKRADWLRS